jgi:hypothetical protein
VQLRVIKLIYIFFKINKATEIMSNLANSNNENFLSILGEGLELNEEGQKLTEKIGESYIKDPDEVVIRQFGKGKIKGAHGSLNFLWGLPGKDSKQELWREVVAVRGFIIKSKNGLILWGKDEEDPAKKEEKKSTGPICSSTSNVFGDLHLKGSKAYPYPDFYSPQEYQVPNTPIIDMETKFKFRGSRGLSCADCVRRGDNNQDKAYCSINASIVFAVTEYAEVGLTDELVWNPITKFPSMADPSGENGLYGSPVLVHIPISKTAYFKNQEVETTATKRNSIVPPEAVPFRKFWLNMAQERNLLSLNNPITPVYWLVETEMYLGEPRDPKAVTTSIPVFKKTDVVLKEDRDKLTLFKSCLDQYTSLVEEYCFEKNYSLGSKVSELDDLSSTGSIKEVKEISAVDTESDTTNQSLSNGNSETHNFKVWSK